MKIVYIADARSPIAQNWINYFVDNHHEVFVISTYPCAPGTIRNAQILQSLVAFSQFAKVGREGTLGQKKEQNLLFPLLSQLRVGVGADRLRNVHRWLSALDLARHVQMTHRMIKEIAPDLVHAMRIPFEGILAAKATPKEIPLLVSVWGNDFTLHASQSRLVGHQTRSAMKRASALHCDCHRDLQMAKCWGFDSQKPDIVLPGAGGIQSRIFAPGPVNVQLKKELHIPSHSQVVINPRGFRNYVCNDAYFQAIPLVLQKYPDTIFVSSAMQGNPTAEKWLSQLGIKQSVRLLPLTTRKQMAELFRLSTVTVSPSLHDGTPNTLLEAMACGCFPVAGDIESVREWIDHGINGLLCEPTNPAAIAANIIHALDDTVLREAAQKHNLHLIAKKADYDMVMEQAEKFYLDIVSIV